MLSSKHKMILSSGRFSGTSRGQLTAAFDQLASSPNQDKLVIHFHGGLVSEKSGEEIADRLLPFYQGAGGYPFFVLWQSGLIETVKNNWREMIGEDVFSLLVEKVMQFVLGKLDQAPGEKGLEVELPSSLEVRDVIETKQAAGEVPYAERDDDAKDLDGELTPTEQAQFEALLSTDAAFISAASEISRSDAPELNPVLEAELAEAQVAAPGEKGLVSTTTLVAAGVHVLARVVKRFAGRRDHGIYATVVEEVARELKGDLIGGLLWKHIKKDTEDTFIGNSDTHGGVALLEEISRLWQTGHKPRILLIGHSAGSIYICNLLKKAAETLPQEIRFEVVFLAPGCSFNLLDKTFKEAGDRIAAFRSFGMADELEMRDAILPPVYLYSLLYCVSGLFEEKVDLPLVGMQRYHGASTSFDPGQFPEIKRVLNETAAFAHPWIWSDSAAGSGLNTLSHSHGSFDNEEKTLESLAFLISHGGF
ncbi:MAG: hypothetical protein A2W35_21720 [Chloroflexi bacterium RBG_16_57_11]|nr:MAG: hypothetical protein A2W35_21720 [Chloroflexi bacterium RBG_16_57_11]